MELVSARSSSREARETRETDLRSGLLILIFRVGADVVLGGNVPQELIEARIVALETRLEDSRGD
jgi:hypothetical protein